jgi:putative membrane-bound dehydrogenase-like protein
MKWPWLLALALLTALPPSGAAAPVSVDPRLVVELVAKEPEIVTPTGLTVDEQGRLWVIESNTHERPANYKGPPSDRVRVFSDFDAHGRPRKVHTFAKGFRYAMSLALGKDGIVYLATRWDVYVLRDTKGKGVADERRVIVRLDTPGDYPHNGLSGFAQDALGNLYFSLGENLGAPYKLIGSDGTTLTGGGEGGSIYRCRPDGTGLVRIATGFWNTFNVRFDAFGRLFAVDNDPDSRGPCRLLHIVRGGDYGYRFRNGRKGLHPFTAWNGELPGTLPMVAGTAEAPCGVLAYESFAMPPEYRGKLLVTSWGDHVIDRFTLQPQGASFTSHAETVIRGGDDFRPVAIVIGPDGALYLSDWVDQSYPVHGKGRIWRIRMKDRPRDDGLRPSKVAAFDTPRLRKLLHDTRREIRLAAGNALARRGAEGRAVVVDVLHHDRDVRARMHALWAAAQTAPTGARALVNGALGDAAPEVRGEAARLLGEMLPADRHEDQEKHLLELATKDASPYVRMNAILGLRTRPALRAVLAVLADKDPFLVGAALEVLGRPGNSALLLSHVKASDPKLRLGVLLALRRGGEEAGRKVLPQFLADPDPEVRRTAIQWVGEERLHRFQPLLKAAASRPPVTRELFEALLATQAFLSGEQHQRADEVGPELYVAKVMQDSSQPAAILAVALRMLRPDHPVLTVTRLRGFLESTDHALRTEAARTLALRADAGSQELLRKLAVDAKAEPALRAEAVLGLAQSASSSAGTREVLRSLLKQPALRRGALRSLRSAAGRPQVEQTILHCWEKCSQDHGLSAEERRELAEQVELALQSSKTPGTVGRLKEVAGAAGSRPKTDADWRAALAASGDQAAGERVFFHPQGPRCFACHRIDGRGGQVGPELSTIGRSTGRDKLIESILEPSKEIAPQFVTWLITTRDGKVRTGVILNEDWDSKVHIGNADGKIEVIPRTQIEERQALAKSIMPDNLPALMTRQEFRDLIAFLQARR